MRMRRVFGGREMKRARKRWGKGPWDREPDMALFVLDGYRCAAKRNRLGAWCGYVGVREGHPWFGVERGELPDLDVHGGVTHVEQEGAHWVVGFDCAHFMDEIPHVRGLCGAAGNRRLQRYIRVIAEARRSYSTYRTLRYTVDEIKRLVEQAKEAAL